MYIWLYIYIYTYRYNMYTYIYIHLKMMIFYSYLKFVNYKRVINLWWFVTDMQPTSWFTNTNLVGLKGRIKPPNWWLEHQKYRSIVFFLSGRWASIFGRQIPEMLVKTMEKLWGVWRLHFEANHSINNANLPCNQEAGISTKMVMRPANDGHTTGIWLRVGLYHGLRG